LIDRSKKRSTVFLENRPDNGARLGGNFRGSSPFGARVRAERASCSVSWSLDTEFNGGSVIANAAIVPAGTSGSITALASDPTNLGSEQEFDREPILCRLSDLLKFDKFGIGDGHPFGLQQ
jgi:hypothetical protein